MVNEFQNQWALILGGSSGLGLATAKKLAHHGMNLLIIHRNGRAEMEEINAEFESLKVNNIMFKSFNIDVLNNLKSDECIKEIKSIIPENQKIHVLVHSIAKGALKPLFGDQKLAMEDLKITIDAMSFSLYAWANRLIEGQLFAIDARIIAFTSEGSQKPMANYAAVSMAKASLEASIRSMAIEWAHLGIKTNAIQAGITDTKALRMIPNVEKIIAFASKRNPQKRLTTPEDVANAAYLLCKKEAAWINGVVLKVDGGESLQ